MFVMSVILVVCFAVMGNHLLFYGLLIMQILPDVPTAKQCFWIVCPASSRLQ
jgi:hypothetical protein